jgi:hypothetical protein
MPTRGVFAIRTQSLLDPLYQHSRRPRLEAAVIFTGKQMTVKLVEGSCSRRWSFSSRQ